MTSLGNYRRGDYHAALDIESKSAVLAQREAPLVVRLTVPQPFTTQVGNISPVFDLGGAAAQISFQPPIVLDRNKKYKIIPYQVTMPYDSPNIGAASAGVPTYPNGNNRISINWGGAGRTDYFLPTGLYGYNDVAQALNNIAFLESWTPTPTTQLFSLTPIPATSTLVLNFNPAVLSGGDVPSGNVVVDFLNPGVDGFNDSIGPVLGFPTSGADATITYTAGDTAVISTQAPNVANFAFISQYVIQSDVVGNSYVNGAAANTMVIVNLGDYQPNSTIAFTPQFEQPVALKTFEITNLKIWITDQSGNILTSGFSQAWSLAFAIDEVGH